ncbi:CHASE3 domain-containing protein [Paenibacillus hunanensis]|uniref:CHASE3 domain-containing protein n=1 Tax=Paenibacillus hunanensis TaxID=539262 RepID=UPI002A6B65A5|nr:CHASE3 domain-containing protein [Paenibacillus hunanensis]WPP40529.1 CHASE3 domain-containing protein [Paenibacillus hunanensis]
MLKGAKFGIRTKIVAGYIVIIVCLGIVLTMMSGRMNQLEQESRYINDHDLEVHNLTNMLEKHVLDMETGQRGFVLTGEESYLEPYNESVSRWESDYNELYALVAGNQLQQNNLQTIRTGIETWIKDAGTPAITMKQRGDTAGLKSFFASDPGKQQIDQLRQELDSFRNSEKALTSARIEAAAQSNERMLTMMIGVWILLAIISIATALLIARQIVGTIRDVSDTLLGIATGGNLRTRIDVTSRDEVGELGDAANQLLDHVQYENWVKDQIAQAATRFQEATDVDSLSAVLLTKGNKWFGTPYGIVYRKTAEGYWIKAASFAASESDAELGASRLQQGEGLTGQSIIERRMLELHPLSDEYVRTINSGLGHTGLQAMIAAPIIFEGRVIAAVEFALLEPMTDKQKHLLQQLIDIFAVTLHSVMTRMEVEQLYRESQSLNHELQAQSEELQVQSEELQAQTEELQMQTEELQMLNERLEHGKMAAESTAVELDKYAQQLQVSSRYKSEFLANMSHELRTPLNSMLILSQILSENGNGNLTAKEQEYASIIHSSGKDLLNLINDILDLSKVEAGKMQIEINPISIEAMLEQMERSFRETAVQRELFFKVEVEENVPELVYSDEMRIQQVLRNLLSNAFKFTQTGGVTLQVQKVNRVQTSSYESSQPMLAFSVSDTGIGISAENRDVIFEAFRQADGATARKYGGTGLGLSISSQLANLLGGTIHLESKYGEGSIFTFYIPCMVTDPHSEHAIFEMNEPLHMNRTVFMEEGSVSSADGYEYNASSEGDMFVQSSRERSSFAALGQESAAEQAQPGQPGGTDILSGRKILIVDDDIRNVYALTSMLERYNMNIVISQNGRDALEILHMDQNIDLILMDIMMPELDGYETMKTVRNLYGYSDVPIIVLTAKAMKEDREKSIQAGATDYMSKPLHMQDVLQRVRYWLHQQTARSSAR